MLSYKESQVSEVKLEEKAKLSDQFQLILGGHIYFQTLSSAVQFDLFSFLHQGSKSFDELVEYLGIEQQPCRILLLGLVALQMVEKNGDQYNNSKESERYLCRQSSESLIDIVKWQHFINYKPMFSFYDSLCANDNVGLSELPGSENNLYQRLAHTPKLEKIFQDAMRQISLLANKPMVQQLDLSNVKFLVDVGGGNGSNIIELAKAHSHLKAAVFDLPSVCIKAEENIASAKLEDRLSAITGNIMTDQLPAGVDAVMFCHFFTIWSLETNLQFLKKAYESLPRGGRVILFNMMQNDSKDGPLSAALGSPYFLTLATGTGMLYSWGEYIEILEKAGFASPEILELPNDHGVIIGTKREDS